MVGRFQFMFKLLTIKFFGTVSAWVKPFVAGFEVQNYTIEFKQKYFEDKNVVIMMGSLEIQCLTLIDFVDYKCN